MEQGWEPPPLLAEGRGGRLLLQDGNHRYEALVREGARHAWVLVYFDDADACEEFRARITTATPDGSDPGEGETLEGLSHA